MTVASDPLFSKEALKERFPSDSKSSGFSGSFKPRKYFDNKSPKSFLCVTCNVNHDIEACPTFRSKTLEEKSKFFMKERLCFGCLGKGHISAQCRNRRTCVVCNKRHPTTLHGLRIERRPPADDSKKTDCDVRPSPPVPRPRPDIAKFDDSKSKPETKGTKGGVKCGVLNNSANKNLSMCVVPVPLRHDHSKSDIVTYTLLDTCSQACFISDEIVFLMSLKTISTELSINTITSVKSEKCQVACGLRVKGLHAGDGSWLSLPKCFSKPNIPVDSSEIPTADSIKEWPYLKSIENELPNTTSLKVGILIGANCLKAIEPLKVIPSQDDGPFAFKTKLGWCVVGPISSSRSSDTISCCRVMVNDHGRSNHLVVEETQVKDSGIESMLKNLFDIESVPKTKLSTEYESFSQDDLHFLEIVENRSEFIDGHYHVPLPFRNENISFPDNRPLALKRLSLLKKKFESSSKFHSDYVAFMKCKSTERVLGVLWSLEDDVFQFKAPSNVFSRSRRGMLSALNSIYDPLGLISPFILKGRLIFQTVCQLSIGWDDPVPNEYLIQWDKWVESLVNLQVLSVSRCFNARSFTRIVEISLHHFSDACYYGYSGSHYLRFVTSDNYVHCSLVMGKSRVVPAKSNHTMPRLELMAATLSSQIAKFISKEFDYEIA
ncbi:uncharacterized protein [Clytia hemisphaerica]|uniref:uncharacterized protein n=1 Tax=Clytia hemisphaerica TaxID=252671 RepID=UPI0034D4A4E0